ncbi:MAG TPA: family 16 glycoside hydrolase [Gemmatimonadaceae bacterium]
MLKSITSPSILVFAFLAAAAPHGRRATQVRPKIRLDSTTKLALINARALWVDYRGRHALKLAPLVGHERDTDQALVAVLTETDFKDGVIEVDVAGARRQGYSKAEDVSGFKGIVGVSFRIHGDSAERFYIRPENTRLDNQLFRNRSTQYEADPDYSWQRLRQESPGVYESYVDVEPGAWTRLRIEVTGNKARLYVNGATQPCLIVNDLKLGESHGKIALWARISSEAYFSNLRVEPK